MSNKSLVVALCLLVFLCCPLARGAEKQTQLVIDNRSSCSLFLIESYGERNAIWQPTAKIYAHSSTVFNAAIELLPDEVFEGIRASARYEFHCGRFSQGRIDFNVYGQQNLMIGIDISSQAALQSENGQEFVNWQEGTASRVVLIDKSNRVFM